MALDTIADRIAALETFRGLTAAQVRRIAREAERTIFRDGQKMTEAGSESDGALVVIAGRATTLCDEQGAREPRPIEAGSMLGETAMFSEYRFGVTAVAQGDVRAVKITREALRVHMEEDPAVAAHFHARLASRLQRVALELRVIDERLATASETPMAKRA